MQFPLLRQDIYVPKTHIQHIADFHNVVKFWQCNSVFNAANHSVAHVNTLGKYFFVIFDLRLFGRMRSPYPEKTLLLLIFILSS